MNNNLDKIAYEFGYEEIGKIYVSFLHKIKKKTSKYKHIYFLSRDGYIFMKIYKTQKNNCEYIYASREAIYWSYYVGEVSKIEFIKRLMGVNMKYARYPTIGEVLKRNDFTVSLEVLQEFNVDLNSGLNNTNFNELYLFYEYIYEDLKKILLKNLEVIKVYYSNLISPFESEEICFFDIGWNGTIQDILEGILEIKLNFIYWSTSNEKRTSIVKKQKIKAENILLYELFFFTEQCSLKRIEKKNKQISFAFFDEEIRKDMKYIKLIQEGAFSFFRENAMFYYDEEEKIEYLNNIMKNLSVNEFGYREKNLIPFLEVYKNLKVTEKR